MRKSILIMLLSVGLLLFGQLSAWAGPPFFTDDPEPVEYHHWEVYIASQWVRDRDNNAVGTLPHFEVNYGAIPDLQIHLLAPMVYSAPEDGPAQYGLGNLELGVKYRFIHEDEKGCRPQVGIFPLVHLPTHTTPGLDEPNANLYLPVWIQKSWGPWTTYGGGGVEYHPGTGNKSFLFGGWLIQRDLSKKLTLGAEIFSHGPQAAGAGDETLVNAGGYYNLSDQHHILFSVGKDVRGPNELISYFAYQWTFGPGEMWTLFPNLK
ncbi:MAG: hypothetical protein M0Z52_13985 [Actinomycetota bacterium]|nr:hypothetical protein [Actinomycetota bacterium]